MQIDQVDTERRFDVRRFVSLPFRLYRDCPQWVPPLRSEARLQLDRRRNFFYKHNHAAFFIARQDGEDVGRIAVIEPRRHNDHLGTHNAHFYLFDSIDQQAVANALFDAAADWAAPRGLTTLRGPLGFMAFDGYGMLASGFEHLPAIGVPYNYPYYPRLAETWGFELEERVLSGYMDVPRILANFPEKVLRIAEKAQRRYGFSVRTFRSKRDLAQWAKPRMVDLYNRMIRDIGDAPPILKEEVDVVVEGLMLIADPRLIKFVMCGDELVGFLFCFVDISRGIQRSRGRLFPLGALHILREMRRTSWVNMNGIGILPEYQGKGGTALLYAELYRSLLAFPRFRHADIVQISEFNVKSLNEMKNFGVDFYKTHHIYRRTL